MDLKKNNTTLVVGQNGAGKSTMLDALSFALFGKAHRNISKPQLVNSINNKNCRVEVSFTTLGSDFRVIRGIKPSVFEIWRNGEMINQLSHAKEYQKILERNILKLNHKSFHQIVVLGSSSFVPFMQLSSINRRDVIEDLLDINVFSKMNNILKENTSLLRDQIKEVTHQITVNQTQHEAQKKYIRDIGAINKEQREAKLQLIDDHRCQIKTLNETNITLSEFISEKSGGAEEGVQRKSEQINQLNQYKSKFNSDIKKLVEDANFFEQNDTCPVCTQSITEETKSSHIADSKKKAAELNTALVDANTAIEGKLVALAAEKKIVEECRRVQSNICVNNQSISQFQSAIDRTQAEMGKLDSNVNMDQAAQELDSLSLAGNNLVEKKLALNEQLNYNVVMGVMLKDTGIKTKIVKQYLPVINQLCNQYLEILDFYVSFNLDEAFQETIRSRFRDTFSYDSFSEGEKQRIDLALLFTWRMVAKMKNSVATNLLILDETFDSSLDHEGVDNLMKIIYTLGKETNIFIISHKREILDDKFENKLEVIKDKNFSRII